MTNEQLRNKDVNGFGNGGQYAAIPNSAAAIDFADTPKTEGKGWTSYDGVAYTPKIGAGAASYIASGEDGASAFAQLSVAATADGVFVRTVWEGESEVYEEKAPFAFDQGRLLTDSDVMRGADWDNEVVHDGVRYIPFATTSRVGVIAFSPKLGAAVISACPAEGTDEGEGTGAAFFYVSENPAWDDLGENFSHVAFGGAHTAAEQGQVNLNFWEPGDDVDVDDAVIEELQAAGGSDRFPGYVPGADADTDDLVVEFITAHRAASVQAAAA